ncbi:MAG: hypothetical protein KTR15_15825 [Phycisphaeraceae bacterium]|nr:hypothetical protein [Phycisphaeraceae bacterium]
MAALGDHSVLPSIAIVFVNAVPQPLSSNFTKKISQRAKHACIHAGSINPNTRANVSRLGTPS